MTFRDISTGNVIDYNGEFGLTKQAASFFDFKIKGDVSISFKIHNNSYNRNVLGYYTPNQINSISSTRKRFELLDKGISIAIGFIIISRVDESKMEVYFISGNSNWFNQLSAKITDFDYEGYEVFMNQIESRKAATEGIIFPLVDWYAKGNKASNTFIASNILSTGWPSNENGRALQEFFPCFYIKSIFKEITRNTGVGFSGNVFQDKVFNSLLCTPSSPEIEVPEAKVYDSLVRVKRSTTQPFLIASRLVEFDQITRINNNERFSGYKYNCGVSGVIKITVNIYFSTAQAYQVDVFNDTGSVTTTIIPFTVGRTDLNYYGYIYVSVTRGDLLSIYLTSDGTFPSYSIDEASNVQFELEKTIPAILTSDTYPGFSLVPSVLPSSIVPSITALDMVKFIAFYFGCVCTYDEYANTISINIVDRITTQEDWSDYYVSHLDKFETGIAKNNYIQTEEPQEDDLLAYNDKSKVMFGGGNIETDYQKVQDREVYKIPFAPADDISSINGIYLPYINFYDIKQDDKITMTVTTVTNNAGVARFNGSNSFKIGDLVSMKSSIYNGAGIVSVANAAYIEVHGVIYKNNDSGTIIKLDYSTVKGSNRLLFALPGYNLSDSGTETSYNYVSGAGLATAVNSTTGCIAFFDKVPVASKPIDNIKQSLSIDSVNSRNISIAENYHGVMRRAFNNPLIEAKMILPQSVFYTFNFDRFIYLKTDDLTGLFYVASITNYKDSNTPVDVNLYML
jgi:hypothetical protein